MVNPLRRRKNPEITAFIIEEIEEHPEDIASLVAEHFNVTRVTVNRYLKELCAAGLLIPCGSTQARYYKINNFYNETFEFPVTRETQEDVIWREKFLDYFESVNNNIIKIFHYAVTEMINNVIDHSSSDRCRVHLIRNLRNIIITIEDFGVGIFEKIRIERHLEDARHALLELSKGKLTTDPKNHSGQGIFFTSRMFEEFSILSGELFYQRAMKDNDDWLIEVEDRVQGIQGTRIILKMRLNAKYTIQEIFDKYQEDEEGYYNFSKTHVPVRLARYGDEQLVSRSQARRILARFENFSEVLLDFKDISDIGQAFADEIFRVYKNEHPEVKIFAIRTSPAVEKMIERGGLLEDRPSEIFKHNLLTVKEQVIASNNSRIDIFAYPEKLGLINSIFVVERIGVNFLGKPLLLLASSVKYIEANPNMYQGVIHRLLPQLHYKNEKFEYLSLDPAIYKQVIVCKESASTIPLKFRYCYSGDFRSLSDRFNEEECSKLSKQENNNDFLKEIKLFTESIFNIQDEIKKVAKNFNNQMAIIPVIVTCAKIYIKEDGDEIFEDKWAIYGCKRNINSKDNLTSIDYVFIVNINALDEFIKRFG